MTALRTQLLIVAFSTLFNWTDGFWGNGNNGEMGGGYGLGGFHTGYNHQGHGYGSGICAGARRQQQQQGLGGGRGGGGGGYPSGHKNYQNQYPEFGGFNNYYQEPSPIRNSQRPATLQQYFPSMGHYKNNELDPRANIPSMTMRTTTTAEPLPITCSDPVGRDLEVFDQKCIFPNSSDHAPCSSRGSSFATGTTAITTCRAPQYYSPTGDMLLEICKDGKWKSDGKSLTCKSNVVMHHPVGTPAPQPPRYDPVAHYVTDNAPIRYQETPEQEYWNDYSPPGTQAPYVPPTYPPFLTTTTTTTEPPTTTTTTEPTTTTTTTTTTTPKPIYYIPHNIDWRNHGTDKNPPEHVQPPSRFHNTPAPAPAPVEHHQNYTYNNHHYVPPPQQHHRNYTANNHHIPLPHHHQEVDVYEHGDPGKCPPLRNKPGVILECLSKSPRTTNGGTSSGYIISISDCQDQQPPGTEATFKCQMYYEPISGMVTQYRKCKESGMWTGTDDGFGCKLECGKSNPVGRLPLITFGETTILGQWPWHAALFIRDRGEITNACGGTLISQRAVLTAAHCVNLYLSSLLRDYDDIRVDLGRYYREKDDPYVQKLKVEKIVTHPAYNPFIFESDIAIIILKDPARIGFHVRPICYPKAQNAAFDEMQLADGSSATVVGWGLDETGESPDELREAKLKVIGYKECIDSFEEADTGALLAKSTTFCAGNNNGTNVCRGDSGSGAYFAVKTSSGGTRWFLQGLVSLGINVSANDKKCDPEKVSIFTRISPYSDWIIRVLSENDAI